MDPGVRPRDDCIVYSFGIEKDDWSFEESVQLLGCEIHVFDAKKNYPDFDRSPQIHFHNLSISHEDSNGDPVNGWKVRTLKSIYQMLAPVYGHAPIDYVKIDIQSSEWLIIGNIIESGVLDNIKQLAIELHFDKYEPDLMMVRAYLNLIKDLEMHGIRLCHHCIAMVTEVN
jgi:Methyltransferase domain